MNSLTPLLSCRFPALTRGQVPIWYAAFGLFCSASGGLGGVPAVGPAARLFSAAAPLYFEENRGQVSGSARFVARGHDCNLAIAPDWAEVLLGRNGVATRSVKLVLTGANPESSIAGCEPLPGHANYLLGNDPSAWRKQVPLFARIRAASVYPGVDVTYYAYPAARLEYDFILQPGADVGGITLQVQGADSVAVDGAGELVMTLGGEEIRQHKPVIYQEKDGVRQTVAGSYHLTGKNRVGFKVANYDPRRTLVIDPTLSFATYLGGEMPDQGAAIATDGAGNIYVAGSTLSKALRLNATNGAGAALQTGYRGGSGYFGDAFVAKFDTNNHLAYLTYLGGSGQDQAFGIAVGTNGQAVVTGFTDSPNFPVSPNTLNSHAFQTHIGGTNNYLGKVYLIDAFVTKLSADGTGLVYSTYLGGNARDVGTAVALDSLGCAYVTGYTESTNFPATNAVQGFYSRYFGSQLTNSPPPHYVPVTYPTNYHGNIYHGFGDAFVAKLSSNGTGLIYASYLGGTNQDLGTAIAVDSAGQAVVVGNTLSTNFPVYFSSSNPFSSWGSKLNGTTSYSFFVTDGFVCKVGADGTNLVYATYLGGSDQDAALAVAVDSMGAAYVTGYTLSTNFPVGGNNLMSWSSITNRNADVFITKFNPDGGTNYSVKFGGSAWDQGNSIVVDAAFNAYVAGSSASTNSATKFWSGAVTALTDGRLSLTNRSYRSYGTNDVFVAGLNTNATAFSFYAYLGSTGNDQANGLALDPVTGELCLTGTTTWTNFPSVNPVQPRSGNRLNSSDAFIGRIKLP